MMEDHEFCDSCPGCRPAMLDVSTKRPLPDDHPVMIIINRVWDNETTFDQRKAFIEVTLKNSKNPTELKLGQEVVSLFQAAMEAESYEEG